LRHLGNEFARRARADRNGLCRRLAETAVQPLRGRRRNLRVQHHIEIGLAQPRQVGGRSAQRRGDIDGDAQPGEQFADLANVVAVAKTQRGWPEQIAGRALAGSACRSRRAGRRHRGAGELAHQLVEGLGGAPVFLALI
jgi:hypothetical protein